jgi:hypothetical protein
LFEFVLLVDEYGSDVQGGRIARVGARYDVLEPIKEDHAHETYSSWFWCCCVFA